MSEFYHRPGGSRTSTYLEWTQERDSPNWNGQRNAIVLFSLHPIQHLDEEGRRYVLRTTLPGGQMYAQPCYDVAEGQQLADAYFDQWAAGMRLRPRRASE